MFVNFNILNQLGSPAINSNTFANRPAAGQTGRLFVSTDTFEIYRDNGTTWDLIGGPGTSTITGTGTATQVAYFTSSQAIGSSSNLFWDNTNIRLGIGTSTPGARLDIHGSNVIAQFNGVTSASNSYIAFQRAGSNVWRLGDSYNIGDNFFELRNSALSIDALTIQATTNKAAFLAQQTYAGGQAQGALFTYNLTAPAGTTFATPNALSAVNAFINLSLGGNATLPAGTRQGIEGNSRLSFTGAGTLTMSQGSTLRAYAAITGVHSFAGSAVGTITHLAGMRLCFPDNIGSAVNITNNYGLLINDQSAGTGTITYTNRWGIYQEGASDLNYFAANVLIGSTVNNGAALQVTGNSYLSANVGIGTTTPSSTLHVLANDALNQGIAATIIRQGGSAGNNGLLVDVTNTVGQYVADYRINNSSVMRLDASGNLGLGVTPSAWRSTDKVLQINNTSLFDENGTNLWLGLNFYENTSGNYIYSTSSYATAYRQQTGQHNWFTAPSGTAGNAISFTQAMTLDASGNLGVGTSPAVRLHAEATNSNVSIINVVGTAPNYIFDVRDDNVSQFRVNPNGNVLIGTTTDAGQKLQVNGTANATQFNSTSGTVSVPVTTNTTFFTPTTIGLYMAHVYLAGNATQTWDAVIIFAFNATDILVVNQTNSANVSTQISGTNIQVRQIGATTYTFNYEIIKIA